MFFKAVVQTVLLFGLETWVTNPAWAGPWGFFSTRWPGGLQGDISGGFWTRVVSILLWSRQYSMQGWRSMRHIP